MQRRNRLLFLLVLVSSLLLSSCIPSSLKQSFDFKKSKIFLRVDADSGALVIDSHDGPKCNNIKGCIEARKGSIAFINFHLIASHGWYFSEMSICLGSTKPTEMNPCTLAKADIAQFSAGAPKTLPRHNPDANGIIDLTALSNDLSKFNLLDLNTFPEDYFYTITACNNGTCLTTDPPIENKGGGGNAHRL